jgi:hypothetical protein
MNNSDGRCNTARRNCSPEDIMAAADPCCSAITSPDGYNAEQLVFDQSYKDLINNFGYVIDYYLHTFNLSSANLLYGEEPTAVFYGPIPIKMYMELNNESISLQSFGFDAADDFTGYVHIKSFEETLSSRDFFIQTVSGDILPLSDYVDHLIPEEAGDYSIHQSSNWCKPDAFDPLGFGFISEDDTQTFLPETMTEALTSLYDQSGGQYTILNKFIENNHELEPKSGDLIDFVQLGCDRPGGRCSKIFQVTERMDQDLAGGLNPMLGHYVWRLRAKRYENSFEPGAPIECANEQVYDNTHNGVINTTIPSDNISEPKSYPGDIDTKSRDILDMDVNDTDIYGSYY